MSNPRHQQARIRSFVAEIDLSANKFHAVKLGTNPEEVTLAAAITEGDGILMNAPKAGEYAEVAMIGGGALGHSGAAIAKGSYVSSNAAGKLIVAVGAGTKVLGKALSAASGADEYFEIERVEFVL